MSSDMDPHIENFYEDMSFPLSRLPVMIKSILSGSIEGVREKLDGQNFTFTVDDRNRVRFMGKGCSKWIREQGGFLREDVVKFYAAKPAVQSTFVKAYDALQMLVDETYVGLIERLFEQGKRVVQAELIMTGTRNIVKYNEDCICLIGVQEFGGKLNDRDGNFQALLKLAQYIEKFNDVTIRDVPFVEFKKNLDNVELINALCNELTLIVNNHIKYVNGDFTPQTVGDLVTAMIAKRLEVDFPMLHEGYIRAMAKRLAYEQTKYMKADSFSNKAIWTKFKKIDDERAMYVGEATQPLVKFIHKLGTHVIDSYNFKLADVSNCGHVASIIMRIKHHKEALNDGVVHFNSPERLERAKSAASRVNEDMFNHNAEGVVFEFDGRLRKLTGEFTAVNRLNGYFTFDDAAKVLR